MMLARPMKAEWAMYRGAQRLEVTSDKLQEEKFRDVIGCVSQFDVLRKGVRLCEERYWVVLLPYLGSGLVGRIAIQWWPLTRLCSSVSRSAWVPYSVLGSFGMLGL